MNPLNRDEFEAGSERDEADLETTTFLHFREHIFLNNWNQMLYERGKDRISSGMSTLHYLLHN